MERLGLIREAPGRLNGGDVLQLVVQRRVKAAELMREAFGNVAVVAEDGRYRTNTARLANRDTLIPEIGARLTMSGCAIE